MKALPMFCPPRTIRLCTRVLGSAVLPALAASSFAQTQAPPDAGALLQQIEQQRQPVLPPKASTELQPPTTLQALDGPSVRVTTFRFSGNTLLGADALAPVLAGFIDRPLDFAGLQDAAAAVATAYRHAGWIVRTYLPRQDVTGGTVTIAIVEAVLGVVRLDSTAARVSGDRVLAIVAAAQAPGAPLNGDALDRALLLIEDLPGVLAHGRFVEGGSAGQTDLLLSVAEGPPATGNLTVDNAGARSSGASRVVVEVGLNSPLHLGDRAAALLLHSRGSDYVRGAYSLPVASSGLRVGVNASHLSYRVVSAEFAALDARGNSAGLGVEASYPLLRARERNLYLALAFDDKHFDNTSAGTTTTRYGARVAGISLYGNAFDDLGAGGATNASLGFETGRVDLAGSPNEAADAASTRTAGSFRKVRLAASRLQAVSDSVSLFAGLSVQLASRNLDSSEKFYLGGPGGVRAYPVSEGGGSQGALLAVEARMRLPAGFSASAFFDRGRVQANKDNDIAGAATTNRYDLQGAGLSIGWIARFGLAVKATWAHRIGSNPNATLAGDDHDGSRTLDRIWLQAGLSF